VENPYLFFAVKDWDGAFCSGVKTSELCRSALSLSSL